jgi:hypothetical protein
MIRRSLIFGVTIASFEILLARASLNSKRELVDISAIFIEGNLGRKVGSGRASVISEMSSCPKVGVSRFGGVGLETAGIFSSSVGTAVPGEDVTMSKRSVTGKSEVKGTAS